MPIIIMNRFECNGCLSKGCQFCSCNMVDLNSTSIPLDSKAPRLSFRDMKKRNKLERMHIKLLSYKEDLIAHLNVLNTHKVDITRRIETIFSSEAEKYSKVLCEVDMKIASIYKYKDQITDKVDEIINKYKTTKLAGLLDSYVKVDLNDISTIKSHLKILLELSDTSDSEQFETLNQKYNEKSTPPEDLKEAITSLKAELYAVKSELENYRFSQLVRESNYKQLPQEFEGKCPNHEISDKFFSKDQIYSELSSKLHLSQAKLHKVKAQKDYLLNTISILTEKLRFHLILSDFDVQSYSTVMEAFCDYLRQTHFSDIQYIYTEEDITKELERVGDCLCELCGYSGFGSYNGRMICSHCLFDEMTAGMEINFSLVCKNNHVLTCYFNRENLAMRELKLISVEITCDKCGQVETENVKSWYCSRCVYDVCLNCSRRDISLDNILTNF